MRDLLFANYAVPQAVVRPLVPDLFEIETVTTEDGQDCAVVSAVPFRVVDFASSSLPFSNLRFNQINYRTHVRSEGAPAIYFFEMKLNSRMITAGASFMRLPLGYEELELKTRDSGGDREATGAKRSFRWAGPEGLDIDFEIGDDAAAPDRLIDAEFLTKRPTGFISTATGSIFKIEVEHERMRTLPARINRARVPALESLGFLREGASVPPRSALYVEEIVFQAHQPARWRD
ncbi:MAG TPA: DUF2071 domain-containing protein [Blastocatellia bacterium]|jgi:uncharacterized protein YqjF (DUF2071 family)|nr:DUF2071 domain-containing protein [Blastocatellia bacterium]